VSLRHAAAARHGQQGRCGAARRGAARRGAAHFFFKLPMSSIQALRSERSPLLLLAPPPRPAAAPPPPPPPPPRPAHHSHTPAGKLQLLCTHINGRLLLHVASMQQRCSSTNKRA